MATIKDVAKAAGVSVATVSRFINGTAFVCDETAVRISEAVRDLDYRPNRQARNLRTTKTNYILVLMPSMDNSFLSHVVRGIQNEGTRMGYSILIGLTQSKDDHERHYLNLLKDHGVDGVILISSVLGAQTVREIYGDCPIVQCSEYCSTDIPYITINNREAAYEITSLLIERGSRRPVLISCDIPIVSFREREIGFSRALEDHSIPFDPSMVAHVPLGFNAGKKAAERLLEYRPDAILAVADIIALGAIRFLTDAGCRVPEDLMVAGFDGISMSREFRPSLTTVIQPAFGMGRGAARLVIDLINNRSIELANVLPYRIAERTSTARK